MAGNRKQYRDEEEQALMIHLWTPEIADDPEMFVRFAFPWGKENTPLHEFSGPKKWQVRVLREMASHIREQKKNKLNKLDLSTFRKAVASGRGIGKSALISWIILWMLSTRIGSTVIVSANSEPQLKSVTWGELAKWHAMAINKHWFDISATKLVPADWYGQLIERDLKKGLKYYYAEGKLWSEENPDAYAGVHSQDGMMVIFDEGSGIPQPIWDVAQGYFTDPIVDRYWMAFSNPRRNEGAFFECFHAKRNFWNTEQIDARTVEYVDPKIYEAIIDEHGIDSRQAKVEVYGEFPTSGEDQFISPIVVHDAMTRELNDDPGAPLVMGVDVARFGDDQSVICFRRGRDARSIPWVKFKGVDTVELTNAVCRFADKYNPEAIFVDGGGVGGGVVDQLKALRYKVIEVQAGSSADDKNKYQNKRVEMWDRAREWLSIGCVPNDNQLVKDACGIRYRYTITGNQMQLERKDEMKKRGMSSPDCFIAGTLIDTITGKVPIEKIAKGDQVRTPFGFSTVESIMYSEANTLCSATFSNGSTLVGKGSHKIFTFDSGWVKMESLSLTNECDSTSKWSLMKWKLLEKFFTRENRFFFKRQVDITSQAGKTRRRDYYTDAFGLKTTALLAKGLSFITKMVTGKIIQSQTLRRLIPQSMQETTYLKGCEIQNFLIEQEKTWMQLDRLQKLGTDQSKGLIWHQKSQRKDGLKEICEKRQSLHASTAGNSSSHSCQTQNYVQETVQQNSRTTKTKQLLGNVLCAARNLITTNIVRSRVVPVSVESCTGTKTTKVYNLTLESENVYYANGVLVANCFEALCQTFAKQVARTDTRHSRSNRRVTIANDVDYSIFG